MHPKHLKDHLAGWKDKHFCQHTFKRKEGHGFCSTRFGWFSDCLVQGQGVGARGFAASVWRPRTVHVLTVCASMANNKPSTKRTVKEPAPRSATEVQPPDHLHENGQDSLFLFKRWTSLVLNWILSFYSMLTSPQTYDCIYVQRWGCRF